uniref:Uncharacterized protein n=1 Tax=Romanomermis culicivorax TaxID=13658 RepID=A0A915L0L3_ROMCU
MGSGFRGMDVYIQIYYMYMNLPRGSRINTAVKFVDVVVLQYNFVLQKPPTQHGLLCKLMVFIQ